MTARPPQIAFAGLGRMGLPMCRRLVAAGFDVLATDIRAEARPEAIDSGARWTPSLIDACGDAHFLVTMLPGPQEVLSVVAPIAASLPPGAYWIDMSTASPATGRTVAAATRSRGVRALDAPVGGGPAQAGEGRLLAFAGGETPDLERCRPILGVMTERVLHVGPAGSGYAVKLLVNLLWFGQAVATAEALALAGRSGLDLEVVRDALAHSAAGSRFLAHDANALLDGDDLTTFSLARCCEELGSVLALGSELDVRLDVGAAVARLHQRALEHYGDVDGELLGARLVAEQAGVPLRRRPA